MQMPPVAVLADIHGNRWALEATLNDINRRGIRAMVNLGDCLYGPLDPEGTAQILMELDMPTVSGNEDRILLEDPIQHPDSPSLPFVLAELEAEHVHWLQGLPPSIGAFEDLFLCHGTPRSDTEYLLWEVREDGPCRRLPDAVAGLLASIGQPVVLCGHDHLPALQLLPDGRHVINPGSVGLPAYHDDLPFPHVMEAGSPHARYSIITRMRSGLKVESVALPYDWQSAAAAATRNGRPDWARYLSTGRAAQ